MDFRFALLLLCFLLSGFAALLYQTAWTREFAFLFGTSELAVVAVLAAYMAGLAAGAAIAARFVGRLTRPVLAYGVLELGIALCALAVPFGIRLVQSVYLAIAGGLDAPPETLALGTALYQLAGAFVVLVPCTALMGATLPLLARHAVSDDEQVGPRIGVLYAVNTFGAIAGTLVAAFVLLPELGLRHTVYVGIAANALVFVAAAALARGLPSQPVEDARVGAGSQRSFHWILPAMTISGAVSFAYEVLWTRLLGQVLGGSTAAFASMLASFLLGIALGSAVASRFARSRSGAALGFALAELGIGVMAWVAFRAADRLPELAAAVGAHPASPAPGAAAAGALLLPLTLCIGATFPFAVRLLARDADEAAEVSGRVYAWNTLGSIVGAVLAGFWLLPSIGLERTALAGSVTSLLLAAFAAFVSVPRRLLLAAVATTVLVAVLVVGLPRPENLLMHSAIGRGRGPGELFYLGIGRSATVSVAETQTGWRIMTNGLPEAAVDRPGRPDARFNETAWLSLLPTIARPEAKRMLIIGLGAGRTLDAVADTLDSIDVIELEEEVVVANRLIPREVDPLEDPRVRLLLGDARGAITLSDARYDAIVSQPSHPWTSGASHLYTREFFRLVRSRLEDDGIFIQWIGANFVDTELFGNLMAAMTEVFPYVQVYRPVPGALVFMASPAPLEPLRSAPRALEVARDDLGRFGIHRVEDVLAGLTLETDGVRALSAGSPPNTDDHNRLATRRLPPSGGKPRLNALNQAFAPQDPLDAVMLEAIDPIALLRRLIWTGERQRAGRLLSEISSPALRHAARGWLEADAGAVARARQEFLAALELEPDRSEARAGLIAIGEGDRIDEASLTEAQKVVRDAIAARTPAEAAAIEGLDARLSKIRPGDLLYGQAARARIHWLLTSDDASRAATALALADELLSRERSAAHFLLRARAAARKGDVEAAWLTLDHLASMPMSMSMGQARTALGVARSLGPVPEGSSTVERIRSRLRGNR